MLAYPDWKNSGFGIYLHWPYCESKCPYCDFNSYVEKNIAWHEWEIHEIEMAVPMSPIQVLQKRHGIFKHQSQKDGVVFQGNDSREFWQRAEDRNSETAEKYNKLGLAEYAAIEAFKRYFF